MDFEKATALTTAWVDILCEGRARIVRESTIAKPYRWIFFYQSKEFLDNGTAVGTGCRKRAHRSEQKYV